MRLHTRPSALLSTARAIGAQALTVRPDVAVSTARAGSTRITAMEVPIRATGPEVAARGKAERREPERAATLGGRGRARGGPRRRKGRVAVGGGNQGTA